LRHEQNETQGGDMARAPTRAAEVRDVADFHLRWQEFRATAIHAAGKVDLTPDERWVIGWLVALADRVGESDVRPRTETAGGLENPQKGADDA
jgi:hypothetical protein